MKKTALVLTLILALLASLMVGVQPAESSSKTIVVPDDYSTIQEAIDNAVDGDTVFVKRGTYHESVTVEKPLTLTGESNQETVIIGEQVVISQRGAIRVSTDNVAISGFAIKDSDVGVLIEGNERVPFECRIIGNNIVNNGAGIVSRGDTVYISGNNVAGSGGYGIYVSSSNTAVSGNRIVENGYAGIIADGCINVTLSGNTVTGNGGNDNNGIEVRGGLFVRWNGPFYIYENNVAGNDGYGIQFGESCHNSTVYKNNIERNSIGINLQNFVIGEGNEGIGLGNSVFQNNLVDNVQQVIVEKEYRYAGNSPDYAFVNGTDVVSWDNGTLGNYWSDYTTKYSNASEVDTSGLWETAYEIDESNTDRYPLVRPVQISAIPLLTIILIVAAVATAAFAGAGLLLYHRNRRRATGTDMRKTAQP